jgi:hypothetical protein
MSVMFTGRDDVPLNHRGSQKKAPAEAGQVWIGVKQNNPGLLIAGQRTIAAAEEWARRSARSVAGGEHALRRSRDLDQARVLDANENKL